MTPAEQLAVKFANHRCDNDDCWLDVTNGDCLEELITPILTELQRAPTPAEQLAALVAKWRKRRPCHGAEECCCHGTCADELETFIRTERQGRLTEEQVLAAIHEADGDYDPAKYAYMDWTKLTALLSAPAPPTVKTR